MFWKGLGTLYIGVESHHTCRGQESTTYELSVIAGLKDVGAHRGVFVFLEVQRLACSGSSSR